jgi:two-component system response regulator YesN
MTVLVVDDQISVVSSLIFGIEWKKMGVTKTLKAYSASEARNIIQNQKVDILLCDVEMPVEDGLSLFSWVREQEYPIECIFLTAHADFIYAKEALRLGSFDYILQPARYEDIEMALVRVMDKIQISRKRAEMAFCGDLIHKRKNLFMDAVLHRLFLETGLTQEQAIMDIRKLGIPIEDNCVTYLVLLEIHKETPITSDWENDLLHYTIENVLEELYSSYGYGILLYSKSRSEYLIYIYKKEPCRIEKEIVFSQLEHFIDFYERFNGCRTACYILSSQDIKTLKASVDRLELISSNDVTKNQGVVDGDLEPSGQSGADKIKQFFDSVPMLADNNLYEKICDDAILLLSELSERNLMNADTLIRFYQDFQGILYRSAEKFELSYSDIFEEDADRKRSLKAYSSIEEMKWLIRYSTSFFNEKSASEEKQKTQVDYILQYIRSNIEAEIRRTDIAEAVHLNPNYISRLFRNKTGKSVKEYIMEEKMKLAKELVRNTALPISVITMKVGYNNFSYFAQVYRKMNGLSPAEDREINGRHK